MNQENKYVQSNKRLGTGVKDVPSRNQRRKNDIIDVTLVSLLLTLNMFYTFF